MSLPLKGLLKEPQKWKGTYKLRMKTSFASVVVQDSLSTLINFLQARMPNELDSLGKLLVTEENWLLSQKLKDVFKIRHPLRVKENAHQLTHLWSAL